MTRVFSYDEGMYFKDDVLNKLSYVSSYADAFFYRISPRQEFKEEYMHVTSKVIRLFRLEEGYFKLIAHWEREDL